MAQQPMYQQIAEKLRARIENGELEPGAQLPTELELRDQYSSSRNTIREAIKGSTSQGLVETRPGQGTFVTPRVDPFVSELSGDATRGPGDGAAFCPRSTRATAVRASPYPGSRSRYRPPRSNVGSVYRHTRRLSAGMKVVTSTASHGRCRRPSTRWTSSPGEPRAC